MNATTPLKPDMKDSVELVQQLHDMHLALKMVTESFAAMWKQDEQTRSKILQDLRTFRLNNAGELGRGRG